MAILIRHPLNLGAQIFRINRGLIRAVRGKPGRTTFVPRPGFWEAKECEAVECPHYNFGWVTTVDPATDLGQAQAHYIRKKSHRSFKEEREQIAGTLIRFIFEPGQRCFREHIRPVDRDPLFKNLANGQEDPDMGYDKFFTTFNEVTALKAQRRKEV